MTSHTERAIALFEQGYDCARATVGAQRNARIFGCAWRQRFPLVSPGRLSY
jgi:hypothetical protein